MSGSDLKRSILIKAVFLNMRDISRVCCSRFFLFPCANFFANVTSTTILDYKAKNSAQAELFLHTSPLLCTKTHTYKKRL